MKRVVSLLIAVTMLLSLLPIGVMPVAAAEKKTATLNVENASAAVDSYVDVAINITENPGIVSMGLTLTFDEDLTLVGASNGEAFAELNMTPPAQLKKQGSVTGSCRFAWLGSDDCTEIGTILILTFKVSADAEMYKNCEIAVSCQDGDILDNARNPIELSANSGKVTIIDYLPGDVDNSSVINMLDVLTLCQYYVDGCKYDPDGYAIDIKPESGDVDANGKINMLDILTICQYYVDGCKYDPNGYGVKLLPGKRACQHSMQYFAAKAATCEADGNIEYWYCSNCTIYFSDADGLNEINAMDAVISATGHTEVVDEAVAPTYDATGLTEGSHCSVCNVVLIAQEVIPVLKKTEYAITYHISNNDPYLAGLEITNNNPARYMSEEGLKLSNLNVAGYIFDGWYDAAGASGTLVKEIPAGTTGNVELYARWTLVEYTVQFDSPDVPVDTITYTVNTGATLKNPSHFGYTFVGWSKDGKIMSAIPVGTIGNITLHANWTSDRNKAVAVSKYDNPIIIEDMVDGRYLFIYEIGTIQNVPLAEIKNLGNTEGISISEAHSYTQKVDESFAKTIAQTVTNATTTTSSWSLSEDWNDTFSATTETGEEVGKTSQTTDSQGNVVEGKYYISNVEGGATTNTSSAGGSNGTSSKVTQGQSAGINGSYTAEHTDSTSTELGGSLSVSAGYQAGPAAARVNVGGEISGHYDKTTSNTDTQSATIAADRSNSFTTEGSSTSESHWDTSNTASSSWNSTESYESATATSVSSEISNAISESVYNKYGYSSMLERGGENSKTSSTGESMENTNEYSSTVEYSYGEEKNYTETVVRQSSATGYYRLVSAGTVHVFAVVGYDLATNSYYTYTYNILDTERHVYLDYSKDNANFNDCENAILPFEVPYNVHEFISGVIARSNGLRVNETTGVIEGYNGSADYVVIPEYISVTDGVAEPYAVRVTGISTDAFAGNTTVKGVYLPKYVSEIPEGAFAGCTSLEVVMGYGVSKIGAHAFDDCTNLRTFTIDNHVTSLGEKAFDGVPEIVVNAANEVVADAAVKSGAIRLTLDITKLKEYDDRVIEIADNVKCFAIVGNSYNGNTPTGLIYKNVRIKSNAEETFISNMIFEDNRNTPLTLASKRVTLSKIEVRSAPGFAVIMTADNVELDLYGTVALISASDNAVVSKHVTLANANANVSGILKLKGNYLVCGNITNTGMLTFTSGKIKNLTEEEYEAMLTSSVLTFDPNGGEVDVAEKLIYYGQPYGAMPTPKRTGYAFDGWYTKKTDGTKVTADTVATVLANQTLYAHWKAMAYNVSWNTGTGYTIAVNRTSSPYANASTGALGNGDVIYYGDVLSVTYAASTGYTINSKGSTSITVTGNVTSSNIYATALVNSYTASWNTGSGYTITVMRISSPNAGASTGNLSSGAKVYYGDVLSVKYTKHDYWYIAASGATSITVTNDVNSSSIYAEAKPNPVSGWVKASELPSGAQVINRKWSYTLREYTSNAASSLSGWTHYDTARTSWGAWSDWGTWNPDNGVRNVEWRSAYDHTEYHYYRWTNSNHSALYTYKTSSYGCTILEEAWFNYQLPASSYGTPIVYNGTDNWANRWVPVHYAGNHSVDTTFTRDIYRDEWRYQEPVYTYYFYRDVNKEATSNPMGQNDVSSIVEWVQYRAK